MARFIAKRYREEKAAGRLSKASYCIWRAERDKLLLASRADPEPMTIPTSPRPASVAVGEP